MKVLGRGRSLIEAKLSSKLPPSTSLRPIIARSSPLSGILSSALYANKAGKHGNAGVQRVVLVRVLCMWINETQRRRFASMWPCAVPEKKEQKFKRVIHFSVKTSRNRFKSSNPRVECKGLRINENICTSPQEIAGHFRDYYKELATSSQSSTLTEVESTIPDLEVSSFLNCENILDSEIDLEEIECALKALKLGKSGGIDSLDPEHIWFGGETLRLWLKKIFNALEQIPTTLNEGLIIPVHKGKGKDPFKPESYRGITLSSVIQSSSKLFSFVACHRFWKKLVCLTLPRQPIRKASPVQMQSLQRKKHC